MSIDKNKHNRQDLRVLQKNMVYCSGLPSHLTQDQLTSQSYFSQYGKIEKIVINPFPNRNYCSVYLTYSHEFQAATAILACNEFEISRSTLWCLFGTMKYCRFFLKKIECKNIPNCPYLHAFDSKNEIEIENSPSQAFPEHQKLAKEVLRKYPQRIKQLKLENKPAGQLPEPLYALEYLQDKSIDGRSQGHQECRSQQHKEPKETQKGKQNTDINGKQEKVIQTIEQPEQEQVEIDIQNRIRKLILKQLDKAKGSRLMLGVKQQEKNVKQIMINGLLQ